MSARRRRHQVTGCRLKGRRLRAEAVIVSVTAWALGHPEVEALAVLGSYAYGRPRMASDLDLTVVASDRRRFTEATDWIAAIHPRAQLLRTQEWGPLVTERRLRHPSGLQVEVGVTDPAWVFVPLDPSTANILRDGCRILHDPAGLLQRAMAELPPG